MKNYQGLLKINSKHIVIIEDLIQIEKNSRLKKLLMLLSEADFDDNKAMQQIYGAKRAADYSRLKKKIWDILIRATSLQTISLEDPQSRTNESHNQFRNVLVAKLLMDLRENDLSIQVAENALVKSIKYHITEIVLILVRMLIRHYGSSEYNRYKLNKYLVLQEEYLRIHAWEVKAENYYIDLQRVNLHSLATPDHAIKIKARKYVDELSSVKDIHSYLFYIHRYKVEAAYCEYQKDYTGLLRLSDKTIKILSSPEFRSNVILLNINIRKAWALIQAGRNNEVIGMGTKDMNISRYGSLGWYFIAHYVLKAYLYNGDYNRAVDLISEMINNPNFKKLSSNYQELFNTTLGYIYLIKDSGHIKGLKKNSVLIPEFKLYKFLNTIPVFSKDKRGINVSILLMHIAFLLQRKDYNAIIDRVDSLNQYAYRYLRKDDSFRSNCMIKMVIQMTKADFNPIRTERYTQDLLKQLEQVKLAGSGENIETEIIPYEVLWKIMTKSL
jgi:hypothetical protein